MEATQSSLQKQRHLGYLGTSAQAGAREQVEVLACDLRRRSGEHAQDDDRPSAFDCTHLRHLEVWAGA